VIINRVWAMPNKWTFKIPPIAELIARYVGDGKGWVDPFAGMYSPAEFTNDLNPQCPAKSHMDAIDWLKSLLGEYSGVLFDPPYSLHEAKVAYGALGKSFSSYEAQYVGRWIFEKAEISRLVKLNGVAITFGWNSQGVGKLNGFALEEVLLVCHGGAHNDTICTVERKIQKSMELA